MKSVNTQNGFKEVIRNHSKITVEFDAGVPYLSVYDSWEGDFIKLELDMESLEEVTEYPFYIEIETYSYDAMSRMLFKRYYKTEADAIKDMSKFEIDSEYLDDNVIKKVKGPFSI